MAIIGLDDLHYAILTKDDATGATYQTPVKVPGIIQANINPNASVETLFADNGPMETAATIGQIELELNTADLPYEVQAAWLGHTVDANGIMMRKASDVPPFVAIGFRSLKSNGKYRYVWLLKGKFAVPEMNNETKGDSVNFQTPTITGSFVKRDYDDAWIREADEDAQNFNAAIKTNWFTNPNYSPTP